MFERYVSAEMLFAEAERRGLRPRWETRDGLFSFDQNGRTEYVYYAKLHCNSQLGSQICEDKSLTHAFLERERLPSIPFCYTKRQAEMNAFFDRHHPLVQKPLRGMRSENVRLILKREEIDCGRKEDFLLEKYVDGVEYRYVVLGETALVQRKDPAPREGYPWRTRVTNLERERWDRDLCAVAESVARKLRMGFMTVDVLVGKDGKPWILELNGMPGLRSFREPDEGEPVDLAARLLDLIGG